MAADDVDRQFMHMKGVRFSSEQKIMKIMSGIS